MKPLVIYHKNCADGMGAAWAFWKFYKDKAEYHAAGHGDDVLPDVVDREVFILDFSYKREKMETICKFATYVTLIDHHKSALDDLWDLPLAYSNMDMGHCSLDRSGAYLAWNYIKTIKKATYSTPTPPLVLQYIQDRDLWRFKLPKAREVMFAVFNRDMTFESYDKLMKLNKMSSLVKEGEILARKFDKDAKSIIESSVRTVTLLDYKVPLCNCPGMYASEIGNILAKDVPFSVTYYDTANHRVFSLRASNESKIDLSKLASLFNGGGHEKAAGFRVHRSDDLAKL